MIFTRADAIFNWIFISVKPTALFLRLRNTHGPQNLFSSLNFLLQVIWIERQFQPFPPGSQPTVFQWVVFIRSSLRSWPSFDFFPALFKTVQTVFTQLQSLSFSSLYFADLALIINQSQSFDIMWTFATVSITFWQALSFILTVFLKFRSMISAVALSSLHIHISFYEFVNSTVWFSTLTMIFSHSTL